MRVLITGAAGRLGRRLTTTLGLRHNLLLGDIVQLDDPRFIHLDVTDLEAVHAALQRCDAVVHMAIVDWPLCGPEETLRYAPATLQVHVLGTHNMLQAAWEAGVRRFVHISSVSVVDGLPADAIITSETRHYSNDLYGMTKGFGEDVCRMFHERFGLPMAILRLGTVYIPETGGAWLGNVCYPEGGAQPPPAPTRIHVDDVTRAIGLALETPEPGYALVHIVGADSPHQWDLKAARRVYGWEPEYSFSSDGLPHRI